MTHHAAALTYYALMSLFPAVLVALSLLGLLGQYPETYNAIVGYLREVAPASVLDPLDRSLRGALQSKGPAATVLVISVVVALYGTTGALEAARRALNVVFEVDGGRSFLRRKAIDVASTFVLMALILASLVMVFVGGRFADLLGFIGLGSTTARVWDVARWPGAVAAAMLVFAFFTTSRPTCSNARFAWVTPGAAVGVLLWLVASFSLSNYVSRVADVGAIYGAFAGAIVLVASLWITNVATETRRPPADRDPLARMSHVPGLAPAPGPTNSGPTPWVLAERPVRCRRARSSPHGFVAVVSAGLLCRRLEADVDDLEPLVALALCVRGVRPLVG
jgi:membrane protein